jgi:hypothetical protein
MGGSGSVTEFSDGLEASLSSSNCVFLLLSETEVVRFRTRILKCTASTGTYRRISTKVVPILAMYLQGHELITVPGARTQSVSPKSNGADLRKRTISLHVEGKYFYKWPQLWSFVLVVQNGPPVPDFIFVAPEVNIWLYV